MIDPFFHFKKLLSGSTNTELTGATDDAAIETAALALGNARLKSQMESKVRPLIKVYMLEQEQDWHIHYISCDMEENRIVVNIFSSFPAEIIGVGGEIADGIRRFLQRQLGSAVFLAIKDNYFDPYASVYTKTFK